MPPSPARSRRRTSPSRSSISSRCRASTSRANLYVPKKRHGPLPRPSSTSAGTARRSIDRVPYGNKVTYQHHAAWFAEHGYVCLIVDTLQLGEVPGLHHGTFASACGGGRRSATRRPASSAGTACAPRLSLKSRKEVDAKRIGVTGRSGGGATSWWVAAADERVKCIIPVAGIADLRAHLSEGYPGRLARRRHRRTLRLHVLRQHLPLGLHPGDRAVRPRPVLLGNSDSDDIFPVPGYRRLAGPVKRLYTLLGAAERFALLETAGPHKDTPELRLGAYRWMNRWLKDDNCEVTDPERPRLKPQQLKVFDRPPGDAINDVVHERFRRPGSTRTAGGARGGPRVVEGQGAATDGRNSGSASSGDGRRKLCR